MRKAGMGGVCLVLTAAVGCGGTAPPPAEEPSPPAQQAQSQLSTTGDAATLVLDSKRCEESKTQMRPFVVGWDATEQSEFSAHGQRSLMVVKVAGCNIELLASCQVPGEYRLRLTEGAMQSLKVSSEGEIYRSRQNVIFEMGYFLGVLGRSTGRVILLYRRPIELPSDIGGMVSIDITDGVEAAGAAIRQEIGEWL